MVDFVLLYWVICSYTHHIILLFEIEIESCCYQKPLISLYFR